MGIAPSPQLQTSSLCMRSAQRQDLIALVVMAVDGQVLTARSVLGPLIFPQAQQMPLSALHMAEPDGKSPDGVADNTMLTHLNEPNLLDNLRLRFSQDAIYVSVNPSAERTSERELPYHIQVQRFIRAVLTATVAVRLNRPTQDPSC